MGNPECRWWNLGEIVETSEGGYIGIQPICALIQPKRAENQPISTTIQPKTLQIQPTN